MNRKNKVVDFFNELVEKLRLHSDKNNKRSMPKIIYANDLLIDIAYSSSTKHYLVNFTRSFNRRSSSFTLRDDDILNHFDKSNLWKLHGIKGGLGIVDNKTVIWDDPRNLFVTSGKPFYIQGTNNMVLLDTFPMNLPVIGSHIIEFSLIISEDRFDYYDENEDVLLQELIDIYFYRTPGDSFKNHINYLKRRNDDLSHLIDIKANELRFDVLFQNNPLLLEVALQLKVLEPQIMLPDIHGQYNQNLKPDLLAYDEFNGTFIIVDYKRSDKNTTKKFRKIGPTFTATVNDLIHQIQVYRKYFDDYMQREKILDLYGHDVKKPRGMGIVGELLTDRDREKFNLCVAEYGKDITLLTYSHIYEAIERYIKKLESLAN